QSKTSLSSLKQTAHGHGDGDARRSSSLHPHFTVSRSQWLPCPPHWSSSWASHFHSGRSDSSKEFRDPACDPLRPLPQAETGSLCHADGQSQHPRDWCLERARAPHARHWPSPILARPVSASISTAHSRCLASFIGEVEFASSHRQREYTCLSGVSCSSGTACITNSALDTLVSYGSSCPFRAALVLGASYRTPASSCHCALGNQLPGTFCQSDSWLRSPVLSIPYEVARRSMTSFEPFQCLHLYMHTEPFNLLFNHNLLSRPSRFIFVFCINPCPYPNTSRGWEWRPPARLTPPVRISAESASHHPGNNGSRRRLALCKAL
ncbi:hypothetical protein BU16DRAFT_608902, partial [Lophium mytilinum]